MQLKSFGCSFIFGSDLPDQEDQTPSQLTWPALLAQHCGYDYKCCAMGGIGNLQILERVLNQIAGDRDYSSDFFVISWTWIDRFDYHAPDTAAENITEWRWSVVRPSDTDRVSKNYYRDLHSEYRDKLSSLSYMKLVIDALNQKGIRFIMTYLDPLLFGQDWNVTPAVLYLQSYVKPYMTLFDGETFLEWSRSHGHAESTAWHPLTAAHTAAADHMIKVFDTQNTNDC